MIIMTNKEKILFIKNLKKYIQWIGNLDDERVHANAINIRDTLYNANKILRENSVLWNDDIKAATIEINKEGEISFNDEKH